MTGAEPVSGRVHQPMIAVHRRHNRHERPYGLQVAALKRRIRKAQRLGEPRDLQMDIALWRVEPAPGDGGVDLAPDRPDADLTDVRDLFGTVAGREQVERALAPGELCLFASARRRPFAGASGLAFLIFGHEGPSMESERETLYTPNSDFPQHNVDSHKSVRQ